MKNKIKRKIYDRNYRINNMDKIRITEKRKRDRLKLKVLKYYSNDTLKCNCCGESILEFLSLDHINGNGSKHFREIKKAGSSFYKWLKRNNFPSGYQVLCMNCNFAKGHFNVCPHQLKRLQR